MSNTIKAEYYPNKQQWLFKLGNNSEPFITYLVEDVPVEIMDFFAKKHNVIQSSINDLEPDQKEKVIEWFQKVFSTKEFGEHMIRWIHAELTNMSEQEVEERMKDYSNKPITVDDQQIGEQSVETTIDTQKVESVLRGLDLPTLKEVMAGVLGDENWAINLLAKSGINYHPTLKPVIKLLGTKLAMELVGKQEDFLEEVEVTNPKVKPKRQPQKVVKPVEEKEVAVPEEEDEEAISPHPHQMPNLPLGRPTDDELEHERMRISYMSIQQLVTRLGRMTKANKLNAFIYALYEMSEKYEMERAKMFQRLVDDGISSQQIYGLPKYKEMVNNADGYDKVLKMAVEKMKDMGYQASKKMSYKFSKILNEYGNGWKDIDGPDSGTGVDYWFRDRKGNEANVNVDQSFITITVNGETVWSGYEDEASKTAKLDLQYLTPMEQRAYTCVMSKGEKVCRAEFGDPVINKIVDQMTVPANKKIADGDLVDKIMRYEGGEMSDEETIALFQELYNSGLWKQLQGHYGRVMMSLIEQGYINTGKLEKKTESSIEKTAMRSIGKWNIKKLKAIVQKEIEKYKMPWGNYELNYQQAEDNIIEQIPAEWFDLWEGAYNEIHNLIDDEFTAFAHRGASKKTAGITEETCIVCDFPGEYDHESDDEHGQGNMTAVAEGYVHWDCYDQLDDYRKKYLSSWKKKAYNVKLFTFQLMDTNSQKQVDLKPLEDFFTPSKADGIYEDGYLVAIPQREYQGTRFDMYFTNKRESKIFNQAVAYAEFKRSPNPPYRADLVNFVLVDQSLKKFMRGTKASRFQKKANLKYMKHMFHNEMVQIDEQGRVVWWNFTPNYKRRLNNEQYANFDEMLKDTNTEKDEWVNTGETISPAFIPNKKSDQAPHPTTGNPVEIKEFGVFLYGYSEMTDMEIMDASYFDTLEEAKEEASAWEEEYALDVAPSRDDPEDAKGYFSNYIIEIWKRDEEGKFGNTGEPLYQWESNPEKEASKKKAKSETNITTKEPDYDVKENNLVGAYRCYKCRNVFYIDKKSGEFPEREKCPTCGEPALLMEKYIESSKKTEDIQPGVEMEDLKKLVKNVKKYYSLDVGGTIYDIPDQDVQRVYQDLYFYDITEKEFFQTWGKKLTGMEWGDDSFDENGRFDDALQAIETYVFYTPDGGEVVWDFYGNDDTEGALDVSQSSDQADDLHQLLQNPPTDVDTMLETLGVGHPNAELEKMRMNPIPNSFKGTKKIHYRVAKKPAPNKLEEEKKRPHVEGINQWEYKHPYYSIYTDEQGNLKYGIMIEFYDSGMDNWVEENPGKDPDDYDVYEVQLEDMDNDNWDGVFWGTEAECEEVAEYIINNIATTDDWFDRASEYGLGTYHDPERKNYPNRNASYMSTWKKNASGVSGQAWVEGAFGWADFFLNDDVQNIMIKYDDDEERYVALSDWLKEHFQELIPDDQLKIKEINWDEPELDGSDIEEVIEYWNKEFAKKHKESKKISDDWAGTILQQLGGQHFIAMTGASNFVKNDAKQEIYFKIGRNANSINYVKIRLTSMDLYDMEFIRMRAGQMTVVSKADGIYNDQLQEIFTQHTGMYTSLGAKKADLDLEEGEEDNPAVAFEEFISQKNPKLYAKFGDIFNAEYDKQNEFVVVNWATYWDEYFGDPDYFTEKDIKDIISLGKKFFAKNPNYKSKFFYVGQTAVKLDTGETGDIWGSKKNADAPTGPDTDINITDANFVKQMAELRQLATAKGLTVVGPYTDLEGQTIFISIQDATGKREDIVVDEEDLKIDHVAWETIENWKTASKKAQVPVGKWKLEFETKDNSGWVDYGEEIIEVVGGYAEALEKANDFLKANYYNWEIISLQPIKEAKTQAPTLHRMQSQRFTVQCPECNAEWEEIIEHEQEPPTITTCPNCGAEVQTDFSTFKYFGQKEQQCKECGEVKKNIDNKGLCYEWKAKTNQGKKDLASQLKTADVKCPHCGANENQDYLGGTPEEAHFQCAKCHKDYLLPHHEVGLEEVENGELNPEHFQMPIGANKKKADEGIQEDIKDCAICGYHGDAFECYKCHDYVCEEHFNFETNECDACVL